MAGPQAMGMGHCFPALSHSNLSLMVASPDTQPGRSHTIPLTHSATLRVAALKTPHPSTPKASVCVNIIIFVLSNTKMLCKKNLS